METGVVGIFVITIARAYCYFNIRCKWSLSKRLPKVYGDAPTALNLNTTTNNFLIVSEARQHEIQERTRRLLEKEDDSPK